VVHTSPGKTHCWWTLDKPYPAEEVEALVKKITYVHRGEGADVSSWGRNKLLRLPGSVNTSYDFPEDVTAEMRGTVYTLAEIAAAYADHPEPPKAGPKLTRGAIEHLEAPAELPEFLTVQEKLPADFPINLITDEPVEGMRSEMRWKLIATLVEAGLTDEETAAIAWEARCSDKWHGDPRGIDGLWYEIAKERVRYEERNANPPEADEPRKPKRERTRPKPVHILTAHERAEAKELFDHTWLGEYEAFVKSHVKIYNPRYNLAAGLMALSNCLGEIARISIDGRDVPLNLYIIMPGETTSGKSLAKRYMFETTKGCYIAAGNPNLGSNTSSQALFEIIHKRAGHSSMLVSDEADGFLHSLQDKSGWQADLMAKITDLYDGMAEPQQRRGQTDGEWSPTSFGMFLSGTEVKITEATTRTMFESGFLARVLWFVGERMDIPMRLKGVRFSRRDSMDEQKAQYEAWHARFVKITEDWNNVNFGKAGYLTFIDPDSEETADWFHERTSKIEDGQLFDQTDDGRVLTAAATRANISAAKIAALLALSDGRDAIAKQDFMVALWIIEQCLGDMVYMFERVNSSLHAKNLDMLETVIAQVPTGRHSSEVYKIGANKGWTKRDVDGMVEELRSQKRLKQKTGAGGFGFDWEVI
jgi:hypothetical protein